MVAPKPIAVAPFEKQWVIYFDFDEDTIRPQDTAILDDVVKIYKEHQKSTIALVGHTDSIGTDEYNVDLSWRRVRAAQSYLWAHGIADTVITVAAHGEATPAATNDTPEGRSLNRRVTLHLKQL
ncbi:MAG: OmpA family protein [Negativicutes bacterium]|nr:OmpA family protein [Negativicutes bacterium]